MNSVRDAERTVLFGYTATAESEEKEFPNSTEISNWVNPARSPASNGGKTKRGSVRS